MCDNSTDFTDISEQKQKSKQCDFTADQISRLEARIICGILTRTSRTLQNIEKKQKKANMCVITARTSQTLVNRNKNQNSVISQQIRSQDWKLESCVAYRHGLHRLSKSEKKKEKANMCVITARKRKSKQSAFTTDQFSRLEAQIICGISTRTSRT